MRDCSLWKKLGRLNDCHVFLSGCSLTKGGICISFLIHPIFSIPAAGREISVLGEKVSSVCRGTCRFELSEGKVRLLGAIGSPISIIPYLEELDLQSKSIFRTEFV